MIPPRPAAPAIARPGTAPPPAPPLPASEIRLRDAPRFVALRERLLRPSRIEAQELARLLGCPVGGESGGVARLLVEAGLVTQAELQMAKERKRTDANLPLWAALQELNLLGDRALAMAYAVSSLLPYIELHPTTPDPEALRYLDGRSATQWEACPLALEGEELLLAVADPRLVNIDEAASLAERPVRLVVAPREALLKTVAHWYSSEEAASTTHPLGILDLRGIVLPASEAELAEEARKGQQVVPLVNSLLLLAIQRRASDLHLIPEAQHLRIQFRIDGKILPLVRLPLTLHTQIISRIKVLAGMDIAERRLPQDGNIRVRLADRVMDLRVSSIPSVLGEDMVLRLLDHQQGLVRLEQLGFFAEDQEILRRAVLPHGLILVTGPTGSGKSTTLRSALEFILRQESRHVLTVEDPVEVKMDGVTQVQVNPKIQFTFARALRHFLRHDPDVILVGEIRDGETARIAVQAALTGHLVLSTLHTNDAAGAVTRLLDMGVEPYLVSAALSLVIAQRLVRVLCPACRVPRPLDEPARSTLRSMGWDGPVERLYQPKGCQECGATGFHGRTILYEMLPVGDTIREMIARREESAVLRRHVRALGCAPLVQCGARKAVDGITTLEEAAVFLEIMGEGSAAPAVHRQQNVFSHGDG